MVWCTRRAVSNFLRIAQGQSFRVLIRFRGLGDAKILARNFWSPGFGLALLGGVHGEPPERAHVVGFVVSVRRVVSRALTFQEDQFREYVGVRFETHERFGPESARGCCLPIACFR